jgi:hypothetical protein
MSNLGLRTCSFGPIQAIASSRLGERSQAELGLTLDKKGLLLTLMKLADTDSAPGKAATAVISHAARR